MLIGGEERHVASSSTCNKDWVVLHMLKGIVGKPLHLNCHISLLLVYKSSQGLQKTGNPGISRLIPTANSYGLSQN